MSATSFPAPPKRRAGLLAGLFLIPALTLLAGGLTETFEKTYDLAGITKVRLQNVNGTVRVETWDKDQFRLTATKRATGTRAEQNLKETEIRVGKTGSAIEVETILPKRNKLFGLFFWGNGTPVDVNYDLQLPASTALDIETVNGKIVAERRGAGLTLSSVNGSIRVDAQGGPLRATTVNGSVEVEFAGPIRAADLETVNGSVSVAGTRDSSIRCDLQTVNGKIQSEFTGLSVEGKWGPREAKGTVNGGRERVAIQTVNGSVRLHVLDATVAKR